MQAGGDVEHSYYEYRRRLYLAVLYEYPVLRYSCIYSRTVQSYRTAYTYSLQRSYGFCRPNTTICTDTVACRAVPADVWFWLAVGMSADHPR
jgi:hypothetical protein